MPDVSEGAFGSGAVSVGKSFSDGASPLCSTATSPPCPKCGGPSIKRGKHKNGAQRYGCTKCNIKFQAEYKDIRGEGNPNWKGDKALEDTARERISQPDSSAYIPVPNGYERHHIDGNPYNNDPKNILVVQRKEHMINDGRLAKLSMIRDCKNKKHSNSLSRQAGQSEASS